MEVYGDNSITRMCACLFMVLVDTLPSTPNLRQSPSQICNTHQNMKEDSIRSPAGHQTSARSSLNQETNHGRDM